MKLLSGIKSAVNDLFFTEGIVCPTCGYDVFDDNIFCKDCLKTIPFNNGDICEKCGRKTITAAKYCLTCKVEMPSFEYARSAFVYKEPFDNLIKGLKLGGKKYLANELGIYLYRSYQKYGMTSDAAVFVPSHEKRVKQRGYCHAELLAKRFCTLSGLPLLSVLTKKKDTVSQTALTQAERKRNLINSFGITDKTAVKGKNLLLIDDIITTAATASEVAETLKKAGALSVKILTLASLPDKNIKN